MENRAYINDALEDVVQLEESNRKRKTQKIYTYQEAIEETNIGKFHYLLLVVCGLGYMAASVEIIGVSIVMFSADCDLKLTVHQQGMLGSIGYFGVVLSSHVMGFSADTWGRVRTIRISLLASVCASIMSVFSVNTFMLATCRFFTGFFISASQSCVYTLLGEYHTPKTRMNHVTILASFLVIGLIYIQVMAVLILPLNSISLSPWRLILIVNAIPSIVCSMGLFFIPESPKFLLCKGNYEECLRVLRRIYSMNTGNSEECYPCQSICMEQEKNESSDGVMEKLKLMGRQTLSIFNKDHILKTLKFNFIAFSMTLVGAGVYMWLLPVLKYIVSFKDQNLTVCEAIKLVKEKNSNTTLEENCKMERDITQFKILLFINIFYFICFIIAAIISTVVGSRLSTNFGGHILKISILVFWYVLGAFFIFLIYWSNAFVLSIISLAMVAQIANWVGVVSGIATEYYPSQINAMAVCILMMTSRLGIAIGSNLVGPLLPFYCENMLFIGGGVICLAVFIVCTFPRGNK